MHSTGMVPSSPATACGRRRGLVDLRQERADADELGTQRQGAQEQCGKEPQPPRTDDHLERAVHAFGEDPVGLGEVLEGEAVRHELGQPQAPGGHERDRLGISPAAARTPVS